jgi:hypothetical protein
VDRLRWILRQQRENFLPLKIIRGRLTEQGDEIDEVDLFVEPDGDAVSAEVVQTDAQSSAAGHEATIEAAASSHPAAAARQREPVPGPGASGSGPAGDPTAATSGESPSSTSTARRGAGAGTEQTPSPGSGQPPRSGATRGAGTPLTDAGEAERQRSRTGGGTALEEEAETFSAEELADACGGTVAMVRDLQQFGLIASRTVVGGTPYYDASALDVARAAAGFSRYGVEARHLRAWRNAADREAGIFEQVIVPLLRQRNPEARRQAAATLQELATLGGDLRQALVAQALRQIR